MSTVALDMTTLEDALNDEDPVHLLVPGWGAGELLAWCGMRIADDDFVLPADEVTEAAWCQPCLAAERLARA